jgi:hypothetical protein
MITSGEFERAGKEGVMVYFEVLSQQIMSNGRLSY